MGPRLTRVQGSGISGLGRGSRSGVLGPYRAPSHIRNPGAIRTLVLFIIIKITIFIYYQSFLTSTLG